MNSPVNLIKGLTNDLNLGIKFWQESGFAYGTKTEVKICLAQNPAVCEFFEKELEKLSRRVSKYIRFYIYVQSSKAEAEKYLLKCFKEGGEVALMEAMDQVYESIKSQMAFKGHDNSMLLFDCYCDLMRTCATYIDHEYAQEMIDRLDPNKKQKLIYQVIDSDDEEN